MNYSHLTKEELTKLAQSAYEEIENFMERCARGHATEEDEKAYEVATRSYQSAVYYLDNPVSIGAKKAQETVTEMARTHGTCTMCGDDNLRLFNDECADCQMSDFEYADRHGILADCLEEEYDTAELTDEELRAEVCSFLTTARQLFTHFTNNK